MRRIFYIILIFCFIFWGGATTDMLFAQNETETSEGVLMFKDYTPAVVELHNGKLNHQRQANIFLKNSSLVYKQGKDVMQARMDIIRHVIIGGKVFMTVNNRLAEIVDSCGANKLLRVKIIDMDALEHYRLNEGSVTNFEIGDNVSVTRLERDVTSYPVSSIYYFFLNGKVVECHERAVFKLMDKRKKVLCNRMMEDSYWSWGNKESLMQMLNLLSE